ncbi:MAG: ribulose-phosphate 3-epimerase [bacterium]|nr:ribulose-phosphate 3-epimerase [bacterium]
MTPLLAPSLLSADFTKLEDQIKQCEQGGADWIHLDVMDGCFVPPITFGPIICQAVKKVTTLPIDVHLMIIEPERQIEPFVQAGADSVTVHVESCNHLHRVIQTIHSKKIKAGVALNPATPLAMIEPILSEVDLVLVMSVNPGWGGQQYLSVASEKIRTLAQWKKEKNLKLLIEVDGGIHQNNIQEIVGIGAEVIVVGNAVFHHGNIQENLNELRKQFNK